MRVPLFAARRAIPVALTLSGNEITDATRAAGVQGDGLSGDSSYGLWEATTNLVTNGGLETNTTGWDAYAGATVTRDATQAKFGAYALKVVTPGVANNEGMTPNSPTGHVATTTGTTLTGSMWVYTASGGEVVVLALDEFDSGHAYLRSTVSSTVTLTAGWQRMTVSATMGVSAAYAGLSFRTRTSGAAQAITVWLDGIQLEALAYATPYVHTDGGTASRSATQVRFPSSLLNTTQCWAALRVRAGDWPALGAANVTLIDWRDDANNRLTAIWTPSATAIQARRAAGGSSALLTATYSAVTLNTLHTFILTFTATVIGASLDGAVLTTTANSNIPTLAATLADIGSVAGTGLFDGSVLWFLCGKGTLTNADAALLHSFGNADPNPRLIPASARLTGQWGANNGMMRTYVA